MRKNLAFYIVAFAMLIVAFWFFSKAFAALVRYADNNNRANFIYSGFQNLSRNLKNAAVLNPTLERSAEKTRFAKLFATDSATIMAQVHLLKRSIRDSVNIKILDELEKNIVHELTWILSSSVPDSIMESKSSAHLSVLVSIDSLVNEGIRRTSLVLDYRKTDLQQATQYMRTWMIVFLLLAATLLGYTTLRLFKQSSKTRRKEAELETVLNRISDSVISVDKDWRYTFLNEAAVATHPLGKNGTLGKSLWDIHPGLKGTLFGDKYEEAMRTRKVVAAESYYPPMDAWFSVKIYPSNNGLTIFFNDITENKRAEQQLSKTLKELTDYKVALDESSIVAITDQKGIIKHANQNFCKISKYTFEELIGQDHRIVNSGHHPAAFIRDLWVTIANGNIWKGELKNRAKDGTIYWVDTTIIPFLDDNGKPYQYVAIRADITERKLAEETLKKSLKELADYKYALDESSIIAITDQKGIIKHANQNFCNISKYTLEELIGQDHRIINSGYHPREFIRTLWTTIANGKIWKGEIKNKAKDGTIYWVDTTIIPFLDDKGKPYQYVAIRADITERKKAEEKLVASEKLYKTIASSIPGSVICLLDKDYRYLLIEGDLIEKVGYSQEQLLGKKAADVLPSALFEEIKPFFERVLKGETIVRESNRNGLDIISRYVPLKNEKQEVFAILTAATDVTPLKDAQRALNELNHDLEEKITQRTAEVRKTNEELEAFSYSVSHDLRAPLRAIIGYANILEEDHGHKLGSEGKEVLDVIAGSTLKMGRLIDDLLAFSRMGKKEIYKTQLDTQEMITEIITSTTREAESASVSWDIHQLPEMYADLNTIRQVWINLIGNAVKYSGNREHPHIEIGSYPEGSFMVYYVKDNGAGFDEQYKNKLFKVFQRLHDADEFEGTGVGLALVERIITKHGGKVWAEGKENAGACFYFSLPV